jgi:hypothetical protein
MPSGCDKLCIRMEIWSIEGPGGEPSTRSIFVLVNRHNKEVEDLVKVVKAKRLFTQTYATGDYKTRSWIEMFCYIRVFYFYNIITSWYHHHPTSQ